MTEGEAPYSGVVHSGEVAGYTGAEGYTGVVAVQGSDRPSDAPISEDGRPLSPEALKAEFGTMSARARSRRPGQTESPADAAIVDHSDAPGQAGPLFDGLSPPPLVDASPDVEGRPISDEEQQEDLAESQSATDEADAQTTDRAQSMQRLAGGAVNAQRRFWARPHPAPGQALEMAKRLLQGEIMPEMRMTPFAPIPQVEPLGLDPAPPYSQDLIGPAAELLKEQAARVVGSSRPTNLGVAYIQGIGLGLFDAAVDAAAGVAEPAIDPIGTALRQHAQIMEEIDTRIARGESPWEAAKNSLNPIPGLIENNPLSRFIRMAEGANQIAGEAIRTAEHDWDEAIRLSREAGRAASGGGFAAVDAYNIAKGAFAGGKKVRDAIKRRTSTRGGPGVPPTLPPPPSPAPPRQAPRPNGATSSQTALPPPSRPHSEVDPIPVLPPKSGPVTGKVYRNGPEITRVSPLTRQHPVYSKIPIEDPATRRYMQTMQKGLVDYERGVALEKRKKLPTPTPPKEADRQRLRISKKIYNEMERETVLAAAVANPNNAYGTQVRIKGVKLPDGTMKSIGEINANFGKEKGRIAEYLELRPDGTYTFAENKFPWTIIESYSERQPLRFVDKLGSQIRRENNVLDFAQKQGSDARVIVDMKTLGGDDIRDLELDPKGWRGSTVTPYFDIGDN